MSEGTDIPRVDASLAPAAVERLVGPLRRFARWQGASGLMLLSMTIVAMVWVNSAAGHVYHDLWDGTQLTVGVGSAAITRSLEWWINDALMVVFFFVVGMEIKREMLVGELASVRRAALPVIAAAGGMLGPAAIYTALNWGRPEIRGWGVPVATDIAFALGVLSVVGRGMPSGLRLFLATLAIADDLGALLVIAVFYTDALNVGALGYAGLALAVLVALNALGVRRFVPYALVGAALWFFVMESGVHSTIAGVVAAFAVPARRRVEIGVFARYLRERAADLEGRSSAVRDSRADPVSQGLVRAVEDACEKAQAPLLRFEFAVAGFVAFFVVPVFALANAGVEIDASSASHLLSRQGLGIILGLTLGKPIGITLASWLAVTLGLGELPARVTWAQVHAVGWIGGIGFTMALFIAHLAFPNDAHLDTAKLAILTASLAASIMGALMVAGARGRGVPEAAPDWPRALDPRREREVRSE